MRAAPETLELAKEILKKITDTFFLGSDNIQPIMKGKSIYDDSIFINPSLFFRMKQQHQVNALIDDPLKKVTQRTVIKKRIVGTILTSLEYPIAEKTQIYLVGSVEDSIKKMAGNCGEMALYGFIYVLKNEKMFKEVNVELLAFSHLDHCFIALGRDSKTSVGDLKKWNANTLIIDPWLGRVFSVAEFETFWRKNFPLIHVLEGFNSKKKYKNLVLEVEHYHIDPENYSLIKSYNFNLMAVGSRDLCQVIQEVAYDGDQKESKKRSIDPENTERLENKMRSEILKKFRIDIGRIIEDKELNDAQKRGKV